MQLLRDAVSECAVEHSSRAKSKNLNLPRICILYLISLHMIGCSSGIDWLEYQGLPKGSNQIVFRSMYKVCPRKKSPFRNDTIVVKCALLYLWEFKLASTVHVKRTATQ